MWRVGRVIAAPLAVMVVVGIAAPAAWAAPEALVWGGCERFAVDTTAIPTAQCGTLPVPVDWDNAAKPEGAQAQLAVIRVPATGDEDRRADGQPRWTRSVGRRHRRRDGIGVGRHRHPPPVRLGRLRPARCRAFDARTALPHRRRVRRLPAGTDGRLQPRRHCAHRADLPRVRAALHAPDGPGIPGERRNRVVGPRYRHGARGARGRADQLSRLLLRNGIGRGLRRTLR